MKRHLNLIPIATQRRQAFRRVLRVGATSTVIAGLLTGLLLTVEWTRGLVAMQQLQELNARYAPLEQLAGKQMKITKKLAQLRGREQLSLRLSREAYGLTVLGTISRAAEASAGNVYVETLQYDGTAGAARGSIDGKSEAIGAIRLSGAGVDSTAVAIFAEHLRASGVFTSVAIESTALMPGGAASVRRFEVACTL